MVEIIIQFERHAYGLTINADKSDIPRRRGSGGICANLNVAFYI